MHIWKTKSACRLYYAYNISSVCSPASKPISQIPVTFELPGKGRIINKPPCSACQQEGKNTTPLRTRAHHLIQVIAKTSPALVLPLSARISSTVALHDRPRGNEELFCSLWLYLQCCFPPASPPFLRPASSLHIELFCLHILISQTTEIILAKR